MVLSKDSTDKPFVLSRFPGGHSIYALALSGSLSRLAAGTRAGYLRVFDTSSQSSLGDAGDLPVIFDVFHPPSITSLAFLTDDILVSGSLDGRIKFWSISGKSQLAQIEAHPGGVFAVRGLGTLVLASIGADAVMKVWDLDTLCCEYQSPQFPLPKIAALISLDYDCQSGHLMHPTGEGQVWLYGVHNSFDLKKTDVHVGSCTALSCANGYIATGGCDEGCLRIFTSGLQELVVQKTLSSGILSLAWSGDNTVAVVRSDFTGAFFQLEKGQIREIGSFAVHDLRSVAARNCERTNQTRKNSDWSWRNERIEAAIRLLTQHQVASEFCDLLSELGQRNFQTEVLMLISAAASLPHQLLIRLSALIALSKLKERASETLDIDYSLAETLELLHEPQIAQVYADKVSSQDAHYPGLSGLIENIESSSYRNISPQYHIRCDLCNERKLAFEVKKYTLLQKKFVWPVTFLTGKKTVVHQDIDMSVIVEDLVARVTSPKIVSEGFGSDGRKLFSGGRIKDSRCLYGYEYEGDIPIYFALELEETTEGFCYRPYGVIEFARLRIDASVDYDIFNRSVQNTWLQLKNSDIRKWFHNKAKEVNQTIRQSAGKLIVTKEDEF